MDGKTEKWSKWIILVACIIAVAGGGVYYFGIQNSFIPNGEDLWRIQSWYTILHYGQRYVHENVILDAITYFSVRIGGMSYFSLRIYFTICYVIILALSLFLSISKKKNRNTLWYMIPLWAFFMVFVHTLKTGVPLSVGKVDDSGLMNQLPQNYHIASSIFALLCMTLLQLLLQTSKKSNKITIGILSLIVFVYAATHTDLVFYTIFILPGILVTGLHAMQHDKARKYVLPLLSAGAGVLLVTSLLPENMKALWWSKDPASMYGEIYGATNWFNVDDLVQNLIRYIKMVLELFNIEITNRPVVSLYSVLFAVRVLFVIMGYVIITKIVSYSIRGKAEEFGYTVIDEILAWAYVILSGAFLFTGLGMKEDGITRYFSALIPILTILLCRHLGQIFQRIMPLCSRMKFKRFYFVGIVATLCVCVAEPLWTYDAEDQYEADCRAAIEQIKEWDDGKGEMYVVAPIWIAARLSAVAEGEILFANNEQYLRAIYGADAAAKYVIIDWEERWFKIGVDDLVGHSYEEMCENYKVPVREVELDSFYVFEFAEE